MFTSALRETDVCIKVGKYHQLAYPEIFDLTVFQYFIGFVKSYLSNNRLLSFIVDTVRYEIVSCDGYKKILAMYFYFAISIVYSSLLIGFLFISLSSAVISLAFYFLHLSVNAIHLRRIEIGDQK